MCKKSGIDLWVWGYPKRATTKALRLIHNRPGPVRCEKPGIGPLRRSSGSAREKAIVGKSRVEAKRLQGPAFVFGLFASRCIFWHDIGTLETGGFGIDPAQKQAGEPDFKLLVFNGFEVYRPSSQARTANCELRTPARECQTPVSGSVCRFRGFEGWFLSVIS